MHFESQEGNNYIVRWNSVTDKLTRMLQLAITNY